MRRGTRALKNRANSKILSNNNTSITNNYVRYYAGGPGGPGEGRSEDDLLGSNQPAEFNSDKQALKFKHENEEDVADPDLEPFFWDPRAPKGFGPVLDAGVEGWMDPSEFYQTTGLDRLQLLFKSPFCFSEETVEGPFGTPESPVLIPSYDDARIVGCEGTAPPRAHDLIWHEVRITKPTCCVQCGQIFKLVPHPLKEIVRRVLFDFDHNKTVDEIISEAEAGRINLNIGDFYRAVRDNVILDHNGFPVDPNNPAHRADLQNHDDHHDDHHDHDHSHDHGHGHGHGHAESHGHHNQHISTGGAPAKRG